MTFAVYSNVMDAIETSRIDQWGYPDGATEAKNICASFVPIWFFSLFEAASGEDLNWALRELSRTPSAPYEIDSRLDNGTSLSERLETLWGIRIAATHANFVLDEISSPTNKARALDAPRVWVGVSERSGHLDITALSQHCVYRTFVQLEKTLNVGMNLD